ncbi:MAG: RluA family pseudouridine synthase [Proteobacteria bacterium]|nr:RluA family pseudouridine synthase [Pseudomonadota bacterium]
MKSSFRNSERNKRRKPPRASQDQEVPAEDQNEKSLRLDKFLCKKFDISFGLAQKIIREKKVKVNGKRVDAAYKVEKEDQIEIFSDLKKRHDKQKQKPQISFEKMKKFLSFVIYEDENLVAIDKPSGFATQGGSGIEISVNDFAQEKGWQLVHRLDKDTSGILLLAKNNEATEVLTEGFKNKTIEKTYLALVCGVPKKSEGTIVIPLRKKLLGKNEKVLPDFEEGKEAITKFKVLKTFADHALLELKPLTGRTHQLRVHCKELGHPIVNDVKYGGKETLKKELGSKMCLHARKIVIPKFFGKKVEIECKSVF